MAKETKTMLFAVLITVVVYLYLSHASPGQPTARFSGSEIEKVSLPAAKFGIDETASLLEKTLRLVDIGEDGSVVVEVGNVRGIVKTFGIVDGLKVYVVDTFYSSKKEERAATLVIAEA